VQRNYFAPVTTNLFGGGFERLRDVCFDPAVLERDLDLAHFTGREWLIERIDQFIATRPRGYVLVQAEAGVGKSSLAAHLVWTRPWLHHFTRLTGGRSPKAARKSLAAQLIARWDLADWAPGGVLPVTANELDWLDRLLRAAAKQRDGRAPGEPIVLVVDNLDEAEASAAGDTDLPLGLPPSLPDGVFVVATSRFGIDRALHAVRNPADWLEIEVEGADNLDDMRRFIDGVTDPVRGDRRLREVLLAGGVGEAWFRRTLADRCAGVWIYLRCVLDEIRDGVRDPRHVNELPGDLAGYYAEQIERWRGDPADLAGQSRWDRVYLPLLSVLAAARAPLTVGELGTFAGVTSKAVASAFVEETARAFLNRRDEQPGPALYGLRHQSFRDLLTGNVPPGCRPDVRDLAGAFAAQARLAHQRITLALIPAGVAGERIWQDAGPYTWKHLAAHAAASGVLDDLVSDPGFLTAASPDTVLVQRGRLQTQEGKRALAAFDLCLNRWESGSSAGASGIEHLAANAARVRAVPLLTACGKLTRSRWPIRWAAWSGYGHRTLAGHKIAVNAVAIGSAGDRDVIVSGSVDGAVQVWDAVTRDLMNGLAMEPG
jgi:hypothetical protein